MTLRFALHWFHLALLRGASLLAPAHLRAEWWQEWHAELWHVRRARAPLCGAWWPAEREVTAFCLGAIRDAVCLRCESRNPAASAKALHASAAQCIGWLTALLALSFLLALVLPGVRAQREQLRYRINPGIVLIGHLRSEENPAGTVQTSEFRAWKARQQRYFDTFAFYHTERERVWTDAGGRPRWNVAHASTNLFAMLGVPLRFAAPDPGSEMPSVILSCDAFEREFGGNPRVAGNIVRVGARDARIAGVAPCGAWTLPGAVDAWLLGPEGAMDADAPGYVVAHLTEAGRAEMEDSGAIITAFRPHGNEDDYVGIPVEGESRGPRDLYLFAALLAILALPAVTSVSMGESGFNPHRPSWKKRLFRWGFLCGKIALLLPIAYYVPLDLAYWHALAYPYAPEYVQLIATFAIGLFGMRWALLDQRRRCPVCLKCVTHPAHVGSASRTFLDWSGTELICTGGHTLLHVPGLPTSWFGSERWLYLDNSWDFLFAGSSEG
jgi:hypothetical protein